MKELQGKAVSDAAEKRNGETETKDILTVKNSILDTRRTGVKLLNQLETFVQLDENEHYWISSEGRLLNNTKGNYRIHKQNGKHEDHYKIPIKDGDEIYCYQDIRVKNLVAKYFLIPEPGKNYIYNIDKNKLNNRYDNLIYVDKKEQYALSNGDMAISDLGRVQEYIPFLNVNSMKARRLYQDMKNRCYNAKLHERYPQYIGCSVCDEWLDDKENFYQWVEDNFYTIGNEQIDLDKDILVKGNKDYSPETCVFVPHPINTMILSNQGKRGKYPLGVN